MLNTQEDTFHTQSQDYCRTRTELSLDYPSYLSCEPLVAEHSDIVISSDDHHRTKHVNSNQRHRYHSRTSGTNQLFTLTGWRFPPGQEVIVSSARTPSCCRVWVR